MPSDIAHRITSKSGRLIRKPTKLIEGLEASDKFVTVVTETQEPDLPSYPFRTESEEEEETEQGKNVDEEDESSSDSDATCLNDGPLPRIVKPLTKCSKAKIIEVCKYNQKLVHELEDKIKSLEQELKKSSKSYSLLGKKIQGIQNKHVQKIEKLEDKHEQKIASFETKVSQLSKANVSLKTDLLHAKKAAQLLKQEKGFLKTQFNAANAKAKQFDSLKSLREKSKISVNTLKEKAAVRAEEKKNKQESTKRDLKSYILDHGRSQQRRKTRRRSRSHSSSRSRSRSRGCSYSRRSRSHDRSYSCSRGRSYSRSSRSRSRSRNHDQRRDRRRRSPSSSDNYSCASNTSDSSDSRRSSSTHKRRHKNVFDYEQDRIQRSKESSRHEEKKSSRDKHTIVYPRDEETHVSKEIADTNHPNLSMESHEISDGQAADECLDSATNLDDCRDDESILSS